MAAIGLIFGELTADHYTDSVAADPKIDSLRGKMKVVENESFTEAYYDLEKRAIGNAIQVFFNDGSSTDRIEVQYPVGHRLRREEGIPLMFDKFNNSLPGVFDNDQTASIREFFAKESAMDDCSVVDFMNLLKTPSPNVDNLLA